MPIAGTPSPYASDAAMLAPTRSAPASPGPSVYATASRSASRTPARASTRSTSGSVRRMWSREASSGTTPP